MKEIYWPAESRWRCCKITILIDSAVTEKACLLHLFINGTVKVFSQTINYIFLKYIILLWNFKWKKCVYLVINSISQDKKIFREIYFQKRWEKKILRSYVELILMLGSDLWTTMSRLVSNYAVEETVTV